MQYTIITGLDINQDDFRNKIKIETNFNKSVQMSSYNEIIEVKNDE